MARDATEHAPPIRFVDRQSQATHRVSHRAGRGDGGPDGLRVQVDPLETSRLRNPESAQLPAHILANSSALGHSESPQDLTHAFGAACGLFENSAFEALAVDRLRRRLVREARRVDPLGLDTSADVRMRSATSPYLQVIENAIDACRSGHRLGQKTRSVLYSGGAPEMRRVETQLIYFPPNSSASAA
ncbi:hypothetical protein ACTMTF_12885 [Nonomuraea sp. ZG12]|uniref:hypothetical protein n=1 Tax=Nonomuraea sp. ZG12 TaxID=3452207 RepID=UPI003F8CA361